MRFDDVGQCTTTIIVNGRNKSDSNNCDAKRVIGRIGKFVTEFSLFSFLPRRNHTRPRSVAVSATIFLNNYRMRTDERPNNRRRVMPIFGVGVGDSFEQRDCR